MSGFVNLPGAEGLEKLTFAELKRGDQLLAAIADKVQHLNPGQFQDTLLEARVRLLIDLLRETLAGRYQPLSLIAFAHILVALDYFLDVKDEIPDTHSDGFSDDLKRIEQVITRFRQEIDAFKLWKARQPR